MERSVRSEQFLPTCLAPVAEFIWGIGNISDLGTGGAGDDRSGGDIPRIGVILPGSIGAPACEITQM